MGTSELIDLISHQDLTEVEVYNLLTADMLDDLPIESVRAAQPLIRYFNYKITAVLVPVIDRLRAQGAAISKETL